MSKRPTATFVGGSHDGTLCHHFNWLSVIEVSELKSPFGFPSPSNSPIVYSSTKIERYTLRVIVSASNEIRFYAIDSMSDSTAIIMMIRAYGERA